MASYPKIYLEDDLLAHCIKFLVEQSRGFQFFSSGGWCFVEKLRLQCGDPQWWNFYNPIQCSFIWKLEFWKIHFGVNPSHLLISTLFRYCLFYKLQTQLHVKNIFDAFIVRLKFEAEPSSNLELVIIKEHKLRNRVDICSEFISRYSNVVLCLCTLCPSQIFNYSWYDTHDIYRTFSKTGEAYKV